jgi:hypothetical protein
MWGARILGGRILGGRILAGPTLGGRILDGPAGRDLVLGWRAVGRGGDGPVPLRIMVAGLLRRLVVKGRCRNRHRTRPHGDGIGQWRLPSRLLYAGGQSRNNGRSARWLWPVPG